MPGGRAVSPKIWTLVAAVLGSGIVFLDSTVVNVALPAIGRELPRLFVGQLEGQSYVYNGYLLTLSALLILAGALNDRLGRRRMFLVGLAGFGLTSVLCGLAPDMELLVLFRLLQGAAGALLVPGSLALITVAFDGEERGWAIGVWAAASSATTLLGPLVGGLLVDDVTWRAVFLINVPFVLAGLWVTWRHVSESRDAAASHSLDWLGASVVALAVGGLSFGAIFGQQRDWQDPLAFIALGLGIVAAIVFPFLMRSRRDPLVPLELFRSRDFSTTNLSTFLIYGALYVSFYFLTLFTQNTLGYTAAAAGLSGLPGSVALIGFSPRFGALAARYGPRRFMVLGPLLMALGILWLARAPADSSPWILRATDLASFIPSSGYLIDFLPGQLVFGIGLTIMVAPLTTALMASIPVERSGLGSAINNAISRVGPQLAGAVIFVVITISFYNGLAARVPGLAVDSTAVRQRIAPLNVPASGTPADEVAAAQAASTESFHLAMLVSAGLLLAGAAVNAVGISSGVAVQVSDRREQAAAAPAEGTGEGA
ncbi:MAG TPA: MFS transporter [Candidatus Limnocylindrales bacterium]|nr:MFS transporter [Candidatus Limnocylindrales bacterium]